MTLLRVSYHASCEVREDILHDSAKRRKSVQNMTYPKSSWLGRGALDIWTT